MLSVHCIFIIDEELMNKYSHSKMNFYTTGVIYFLLNESTRMENSVQGMINSFILTGGNLGEITGLRNLISGCFVKHNYGIVFV